MSTLSFRMDIHALRGIAVLLVVLYHTQLGFQTAGFLGVDIFFVLSGFLITGIIRKDLAAGTFSFVQFYLRRAKRILPAAFTTILLSFAVSRIFLTAEVQQNFIETAVASVFFMSNISLWLQSDYFSSDATLKPLLHMWSLAIEEQFYLFLPLALFLLPLRRHFVLICVLCAASLALCLLLVGTKTSATFYLLPTRAWEMLLGAAVATGVGHLQQEKPLPPIFGIIGLVVLFAVPVLAPGKAISLPHPSLDAILVCAAALLIIVSKCPPLDSGWFSKGLGWFGTISFSLYLVHWPIVAFLNNAYMSEPLPTSVRLAAAAASVILAVALLTLVEKPLRYASGRSTVARGSMIFGFSLVCILVAKVALPTTATNQNFAERLRPNMGLDAACEYLDQLVLVPECQTAPEPEVIVWGDSYAMHLVPALTVNAETRLVQATKSVCGPFHRIAPVHSDFLRGTRFVEDCLLFNASVVDYIKNQNSIKTVVLSSLLNQYLFLDVVDQDDNVVKNSPENLAAEIEATAELLQSFGKTVVLIAPPPSEGAGSNTVKGFNIGLCLERALTQRIVAGREQGCAIRKDVYADNEQRFLAALDLLVQRGRVPVLRLDSILCDADTCKTSIGETLLYRDKGHLSYEGSTLLGARYNLLEQAVRIAE